MRSIVTYLLCSTLILGWWLFAYLKHPLEPNIPLPKSFSQEEPFYPALPPLDRQEIFQALSGDRKKMTALISEWDIEAQILSSEKIPGIQRIPSSLFLRAHALEKKIPLKRNRKFRFLPQTYVAASFLLSLVSPDEIVALPKGMRKQDQLYPIHLTSKIPLNVEEYTNEQLFLLHPDIAFAATYSHPTPIQMIKNLGIPVVTLRDISTIEDVSSSLRELGEKAGISEEAEVLAIFIEAAFCAIDNRISLLKSQAGDSPKNIIYLSSHYEQTIPTCKTLIGQILSKMEVNRVFDPLIKTNENLWSIPVTQEQILHVNPECMIISSFFQDKTLESMLRTKAFQTTQAVKSQKLFFVDSTIQETPSQYIVLSYLDLYEILTRAYLE